MTTDTQSVVLTIEEVMKVIQGEVNQGLMGEFTVSWS